MNETDIKCGIDKNNNLPKNSHLIYELEECQNPNIYFCSYDKECDFKTNDKRTCYCSFYYYNLFNK